MDTDSYWPGDMPQCGAALAALLMHITTQWLWEKLKAAYSLKERPTLSGHGNGRKIPEIQNNDRPE